MPRSEPDPLEALTAALGPGAEFDRIRAIAGRLGSAAHGLGDDCGGVPPGEGTLLVSTDASVEGVHFRLDWLSREEIGWRAAGAALSDLAAMGATPVGMVVALVAPAGAGAGESVEVMAGIGDLASAGGCPVLGGDLSSGDRWQVTVTVLGRAARPVWRTGGKPGDGLWVTGALGGARAALSEWQAGRIPEPAVRERFARPALRWATGVWLADAGATAMIDLSDGLAGDVRHLAAASGTGADVHLERIPVGDGVDTVAQRAGTAAARFAAVGGEDYELLVALPAAFPASDAERCARQTGVALTRVGELTRGGEVRLLAEGAPVVLAGWSHFS